MSEAWMKELENTDPEEAAELIWELFTGIVLAEDEDDAYIDLVKRENLVTVWGNVPEPMRTKVIEVATGVIFWIVQQAASRLTYKDKTKMAEAPVPTGMPQEVSQAMVSLLGRIAAGGRPSPRQFETVVNWMIETGIDVDMPTGGV